MQGPQLRGRALLIFGSFHSFDLSLGYLISCVRLNLMKVPIFGWDLHCSPNGTVAGNGEGNKVTETTLQEAGILLC
jgi:hypothetical protein